MANEAQLRDWLDDPIDFIVADGTAITRGTLLTLTDPRTAIATTAAGAKIAGIAARDKIASDGRTRLAVFRRGIFDMVACGSISVGNAVVAVNHDNYVKEAIGVLGANSGATIIGHALETASAAERIQVWVDIGAGV